MLIVENLSKTFYSGFLKNKAHKVINNVSLSIEKGKTLGLVGESGCGKSTLARCILRLISPDGGKVLLEGTSILDINAEKISLIRQKMQIIFQHPYSALNPRKTIISSVSEPMRIHKLYSPEERKSRIHSIFRRLHLHNEVLDRYPHQLSGGQLQRIIIARALTLNPEFIIFDEPTSMLDISVQATILHLLKELQDEFKLTYLFISHDIDVVRFMSHGILHMSNGKIALKE